MRNDNILPICWLFLNLLTSASLGESVELKVHLEANKNTLVLGEPLFVTAHVRNESKHVTQRTTEAPWMNLFHADNLYNNTLVNLTSMISEPELRTQIAAAVTAQHVTDSTTARDTLCDREIAAFAVDAGVGPYYCEVDAAEVPWLYNCVP